MIVNKFIQKQLENATKYTSWKGEIFMFISIFKMVYFPCSMNDCIFYFLVHYLYSNLSWLHAVDWYIGFFLLIRFKLYQVMFTHVLSCLFYVTENSWLYVNCANNLELWVYWCLLFYIVDKDLFAEVIWISWCLPK